MAAVFITPQKPFEDFIVNLERLGLRAPTSEWTKYAHGQLGAIKGQWYDEQGRFLEKYPDLRAADFAPILRKLKKHAQGIVALLEEPGTQIQSNTRIETVSMLAEVLGADPRFGSAARGRDWLSRFALELQLVAHATDVSLEQLGKLNSPPGRTKNTWHDKFTTLVKEIAVANKIDPVPGFDSTSGQVRGRFCEIARAFEEFLDPRMHAASDEALYKRLKRSLAAIEK